MGVYQNLGNFFLDDKYFQNIFHIQKIRGNLFCMKLNRACYPLHNNNKIIFVRRIFRNLLVIQLKITLVLYVWAY